MTNCLATLSNKRRISEVEPERGDGRERDRFIRITRGGPGSTRTPDPGPVISGHMSELGMFVQPSVVVELTSVEKLLTRVAELAVLSVPGASGAGMVVGHGAHRVSVATATFVREIEMLQGELGEGPCLTAVAEGRLVRSGSLTEDTRWPWFAGRLANLGLNRAQSVLSLPLASPGRVIGSLSLYGRARGMFDEDSMKHAYHFARNAGTAIWNMQQLDYVVEKASQIEAAIRPGPWSTSIRDEAVTQRIFTV